MNSIDETAVDKGATMRWLAVQEKADQMRRQHTSWRYGQALFNALHEIDSGLADTIRGTAADPFYDDSLIDGFAVVVMTRAALDFGDAS